LLPANGAGQNALDKLDPYDLRRRALDEKLEPFEIGRLLIHINQRRGFLSNRRADRERKKREFGDAEGDQRPGGTHGGDGQPHPGRAPGRKKLGLIDSQRFNLERGERDKLLGMPTDCLLAKNDLFAKGWWDRPEEEREEIVRVLLDDLLPDAEKLRRATAEWGLSREAAEKVLDADLGEGYARHGRKGLAKLLPFVERGLPLTAPARQPCALREAGYLQPHERTAGQKDFLDKPPELANPLVRQALREVRKVVNAVIREYGKPARIHIELAREVKGPAEQRQRLLKENREREQERDDTAKRIREQGFKVTADAITRYLLGEQQRHVCIYSGRCISLAQLFGGEVDVDHILPYGRGLDNSQMNRVVCFRSENHLKGDRTPYEWLAASDPEKFAHVLQRADALPYPKARRFGQKYVELGDFFARQFVDTAYITTQVCEYVERLGCDVVCTKGQHTAELRRHWGLNTVLRDDGLDLKNREDHRHHAVDAVVIALTNRSRLQQLAKLHKQGGVDRTGEVLPGPWPHFRAEVERAMNAVNVSHRVQRTVRGALHEETMYGPTAKPGRSTPKAQRPWAKDRVEDPKTFVRRIDVAKLTATAQLEKVRDPTIRDILRQHLRRLGIDPDKPGKVPADAFSGENTPRMPSGVPILRVRMLEESETFRPISARRNLQFAKPGSNHHVVYCAVQVKGGEQWRAEVVPMWDAALRFLRRQPVVDRSDRPGQRFIMSLSIGEAFEMEGDSGKHLLGVVRKMDHRSKRVYYKFHYDARRAGTRQGEPVPDGGQPSAAQRPQSDRRSARPPALGQRLGIAHD
jgi:CRISPR-associated endonuclease Csn1